MRLASGIGVDACALTAPSQLAHALGAVSANPTPAVIRETA
jgi:hypothetical protein